MQNASPTDRFSRQLDLLLWRLFGQGAHLRAERSLRRRMGGLASLFALFGISIPR